MDFLLEALTNGLKEMLVGGIMSNLSGIDVYKRQMKSLVDRPEGASQSHSK